MTLDCGRNMYIVTNWILFNIITQAWANYGPGAIMGPIKLFIWSAKIEEIILLVSKS